jgi:hypothetical protein
MMATSVNNASVEVKARLAAVEGELSEARQDVADARRAFESAREAFARLDVPNAKAVTTPEFKRAQDARGALAEAEAHVESLQQVQVGLLKMIGGAGRVRRGPNGPTVDAYSGGDGWALAARELDLAQGRDRVDMPAGDLLRPPAQFAAVNLTPGSSLKGPSYLVQPMVEKAADRRFLYPWLQREELDLGVLALTEFRQTGSRSLSGSIERDPVATSAKANLSLSIELATPSLRQLACLVEGVPAKLFDSEPALLGFLTNELSYQLDVAMDAHVLAQIAAATPAKGETGTGWIVKIRNGVSAARAQGVNPAILVVSPKVAAELDTWTDTVGEFTFLTRDVGTASPLFGMQIVELPSEEVKPTLIDPQVLGILYVSHATMLVNPYSGMSKNEVSVRLEWDALFHVRDVSGVYEISK